MNKDVPSLNELKELPTIFREFVKRRKDLLLKLCTEYHRIEPRNIFYLISQKIISEKSGEMSILDAVKIILLSWSWSSYYQTRKDKQRTINQDVLNAYNKSKPHFEKVLSSKKLETIDLDDEKMVKTVGDIFDIFAERLDPVGASKALHTIKPDLFVLWDRAIQEEYGFPTQRYKLIGEDYVYFMYLSQIITKSILQEISWEKLWEEHYSQLEQGEKQLLDRFSCKETLPKMLDEANYVYAHAEKKDRV